MVDRSLQNRNRRRICMFRSSFTTLAHCGSPCVRRVPTLLELRACSKCCLMPSTSYEDHSAGNLVKLKFSPNPHFRPPSREAQVFHAMEGELAVDNRHKRLVELSGHLIQAVKFGGGLLGHLDKGGQFNVKQEQVSPGFGN